MLLFHSVQNLFKYENTGTIPIVLPRSLVSISTNLGRGFQWATKYRSDEGANWAQRENNSTVRQKRMEQYNQ